MTRTYAEHIRWCKERAREYLRANDPQQAIASMLSDLGKHEETASMIRVVGPLAIRSSSSIVKATEFIEGSAE